MVYNSLTQACFFNPQHVGSIDLAAKLTAYYRASTILRGVCDLYLACNDVGHIVQAKFKACGNPYLIACCELLCRQLENSRIFTHPCIHYSWFIKQLDIPRARFPIAVMVEKAYRAIILKMQENFDL